MTVNGILAGACCWFTDKYFFSRPICHDFCTTHFKPGTAVWSGIMNKQLSGQMNALQNEPFVAQMQQLSAAGGTKHINGSQACLLLIPEPSCTSASANFDHFIIFSKSAFSYFADAVFIVRFE